MLKDPQLGTIIVFNVLRPRNKARTHFLLFPLRTDVAQIVYEPKVKYHVGDKQPPRISDSLLGWLPPVLHTKVPELVDKIGLDAVIYLRFLRMLRWMFTAIVAICAEQEWETSSRPWLRPSRQSRRLLPSRCRT